MSCSASYSGTQVRVDLLRQGAGQEPEPLAGLDRRAGQHDAVDLLGLERLHRLGHREVRLARARRADAEGRSCARVDRVDVALLADRLGPDGRPRLDRMLAVRTPRPAGVARRAASRWTARRRRPIRGACPDRCAPRDELVDEPLDERDVPGTGPRQRDLVAAHVDVDGGEARPRWRAGPRHPRRQRRPCRGSPGR